jgi:endonuclease/exonuclease/phosphatase family metal-dependent hydrolase
MKHTLSIISVAAVILILLAGIIWLVVSPSPKFPFHVHPSAAVQPDHRYLKVMTVNISFAPLNPPPFRWHKRRALLIKILLKHAADIIGTQESAAPQTAYMAAHMTGYSHVPGYGMDGSALPVGIGLSSVNDILYKTSRLKLVYQLHGPLRPHHLQANPTENAYYTLAVFDDRAHIFPPLIVVDTQLRHGNANAAASAVRLAQRLRRVWQKYPTAAAIVMGDINHPKTDLPVYDPLIGVQYRHTSQGRLRDTFDYAARPKGVLWGTWQQFIGKPVIKLPTDLIFVSKNLRYSPAKILRDHSPSGRYPTDHYPVETRIWPQTMPG